MYRKKLLSMTAALFLLAAVGCGNNEEMIESDVETVEGAGEPTINTTTPEDLTSPVPEVAQGAQATLEGTPENPDLAGTVTFTPAENNQVKVVAHITGIQGDGMRGLHIHENGECDHGAGADHFTAAGGHFNPTNAPHACPPTEPRHAGDLGNVQVTNGMAHLELTTANVALSGPNSILGKAIILHSGQDDCQTQPTGNSGERIACGVINQGGEAAGMVEPAAADDHAGH